jgi:hypothetical protein
MGERKLNFYRPPGAQVQRKQIAKAQEVDKPLLIRVRMCNLERCLLKSLRLLIPESLVLYVPVSACKQAKMASNKERRQRRTTLCFRYRSPPGAD